MRIGILGGTFNPIHVGHLILAEKALDELNLDSVIFIPTYLSPHKENRTILDADKRYEMIVLAIQSNPHFDISKLEIERKGKSYSVETLRAIKGRYDKSTEIFFITGADSLSELNTWKNIDEILKISQFVVVKRPGYPLKGVPPGIKTIPTTQVDISSSQIRKYIKEGKSIRYLVPEEVRSYILKKGLYR